MKLNLKSYIAGILTAVTLVGSTLFVCGQTLQQTAVLLYDNIKICIDGTFIEPKDANGNTVEPFIINGTTYLPVRAVGNAFGKNVEWDGNTNTVYLGAKPGVNNYSRTNPAPIGTTQSIRISNYFEEYNASVTVKEVIRGDAAWKKVQAENMFNSKPKDGYEYVLVKVSVSVSDIKDDKSVTLSFADFDFYATDFSNYSEYAFVSLNDDFYGTAFSGGTVEGYICRPVKIGDATPSVVFGADYNGVGGIWFSLVK